jgi:plasmid stabilization system protein ParE
MAQLIITNRAISDIEKAKKWYSEQQPNLGIKFADYIFKCFDEINKRPFSHPSKYAQTRELFVKKYPYLIIYTIEENFIFILRVFPCKTNPKSKYTKSK